MAAQVFSSVLFCSCATKCYQVLAVEDIDYYWYSGVSIFMVGLYLNFHKIASLYQHTGMYTYNGCCRGNCVVVIL